MLSPLEARDIRTGLRWHSILEAKRENPVRESVGYTNTLTQAYRKADAETDISNEDKYRSYILSRWRLTRFDMNTQMILALQDSDHLSAAWDVSG